MAIKLPIASFIRSGINGNRLHKCKIPVYKITEIASFIRSGINGNLSVKVYLKYQNILYRFFYKKWN